MKRGLDGEKVDSHWTSFSKLHQLYFGFWRKGVCQRQERKVFCAFPCAETAAWVTAEERQGNPFRLLLNMAQCVKNTPTIQETQETPVPSLGWEDALEEEMATHSNILAWRIPWTEEPDRLQSRGLYRVRHDRAHGTLNHWDLILASESKCFKGQCKVI